MTPMSILPLSTISWEESISGIYTNKYFHVEDYFKWDVHSPSTTMRVPAIVAAKVYVHVKSKPRFTRSNLLLRDDYRCQYCGHYFGPEGAADATYDHVLAASLGGVRKWTNIVIACLRCNLAKAHHSHIKPKTPPYEPTVYELIKKRRQYPIYIGHESWADYIGWDERLIMLRRPEKELLTR